MTSKQALGLTAKQRVFVVDPWQFKFHIGRVEDSGALIESGDRKSMYVRLSNSAGSYPIDRVFLTKRAAVQRIIVLAKIGLRRNTREKAAAAKAYTTTIIAKRNVIARWKKTLRELDV